MVDDQPEEPVFVEDDANDETDTAPRWPPLGLVTVADFEAFDFEEPIKDIKEVEPDELEAIFTKAANANVGNDPTFSVYRLLVGICGLHFMLKDKAGVFGPMLVMNGQRSAIPADWIGDQNEVFDVIAPRVKHPGLRARMADVTWTNDRKKGAAARLAIDAYLDAAEGLRAGTYAERFERDTEVSIEELDAVERAIQITLFTTKRKTPLSNRISSAITAIYEAALAHGDVFPFRRAAGLRFRHSLIDSALLASDLEAFATKAALAPNAYPLGTKEIWDLAASVYEHLDQPDDKKRCELQAVEQTLAMKDEVGQSSAKAHWIRTAIDELRNIVGTEQQRETLRVEMRELQEKSLDEMSSFSIPMDFEAQIEGTIKFFEDMTLADALRDFARITVPPKVEVLRQEALDSLKEGSIVSMFGATHSDREGKVIAEVEAPSLTEEPSEEWIKNKINEIERFRRIELVNGYIYPAREFLLSQFPISDRHFTYIAYNSPFVPASHATIFALGFARFMQGDYLSAAHLLVPQVENSIRHVLKLSNTDTSKILNDMLQEDRSLSSLLQNYGDQLAKMFTPEVVYQIDLMFNGHPGPGLRHQVAHGMVTTGDCHSPDMIYACWFIYQLVCVPLLSRWKTHVVPGIEGQAF